jgi:hypothetical protein
VSPGWTPEHHEQFQCGITPHHAADHGSHEPPKSTFCRGYPEALLPCPDSLILQLQKPVIQTNGVAVGSSLALGIASFFMVDFDMVMPSWETHKPLCFTVATEPLLKVRLQSGIFNLMFLWWTTDLKNLCRKALN